MVTLVGVSRLTLLLALSLCIILVNASSDCADSFTCQGGETCTQNSQCGGSNSYCQTICVCDTTRGGIFCSNPAPKITSVTRPPTTGGPLSIIGSGFQKNTSSIADLHISGSINVRTKSYGGSGTSTTGLSTTTGGGGFGKRSIYDAVLHYTREASILALDVVMKTYITPGVTSCTVTQFTDSLIVCTMPAGTGNLVMILDIIVDEDVIRVPFDASYNDAAIQQQVTISKITTAPTTGGRVTIYGTNFGTDKNNLLNSFFPSPDPQEPAILMNYDSYEILSSTMMTLTVTPGVGTHKFIQSVGASRVATTLNYTAPVVYYVEGVPAGGASTKVAGSPVTIKGKYFGQSGNGNYVRVTVAGMECTNPQVVDDETIKCGLPLGCGKQNPVVVSVGNTAANSQSSNQNVTISYAEATIITVPDQIDIKGQTTFITIQGDNFCDTSLTTQTPARKRTIFPSGWTGTFTIFVGQTECTIVVSTTTTIVCSISSSAGTGSNNKIYINLNSGLNFGSYIQLPTVVTFPFPYVSDVAPFRNVPQSGSKITISGTGFGNADDVFLTNKRHVTVGGVNCPISSLTSTEIVCSPLGKGFNSPVVVTINGQHSNNNHFVDFANYQFANKFCNEPYGAPDKNTPEYCNCFSGFAPAVGDLQFASCPTKASCPGKIMSKLDVNSFLPLRPTTVFKGDRLFIEQTMPITHGRRDSTISFAVPNLHGSALPDYTPGKPSEPTCDYPGVLWRKSVNSLDCLDVYSAELPWSQHEMCGFVQDTSAPATKSVYKAQLLHTVTDIGKHGNTEFLKISTTSYLLTVSFNNRLTVSSAAISVVLSDPSNPVAVAIVSGVFYNVATKMTLVSFETEVQWPYQIAGPTITASWKAGSLGLPSNGVATLQPGLDGDCETVQDTPCTQSWLLTLDTSGSDCNLDGVLEFPTGNFICRDVSPLASCSFAASNNFSFVVAPTNLCPEAQPETVDASANTQINLVTFADYEHTAQQSVYQVGDMIYIALSISDPSVTIDQITVNTVQVQSDLVGSPDDVFVVTTPGTPGGAVLPGADLKFNITQELRKGAPESPLAPGTSALVKLGFKLSRASIPSLAIDTTNTDVSLTITIVCDILYHGNTKREIVVGTAQHYPITAHSIVNVVSDFETENEIENDGVAENIEEENGMFSFMSGVEQTKTNFVMLLFTLATLFVAML